MSPDRVTRRKLLAGLSTAGTVGMAGCQALSGQSSDSSNNPSNSSTRNKTSQRKPGESDLPSKTFKAQPIEGFQNVSKWDGVTGNVQQANGPNGKALRITGNPSAGDKLWVRKKGLDWNLKNKDLSFALNIDKPELGQNVIVTMRLHAPNTNNTMTLGEYVRVLPGQGWFRIDAGPRSISGIPKLSKVTAVDIMIQPPQGGQTDVRISDVRAVNGFDSSYIALTFDDGLKSQYKAYRTLEKHDVAGTIGVITGNVGQNGHLNKGQLTEMQNAGWDIAAHSTGETPLPEMTTSAMWQNVIDTYDWMVKHGFQKENSSKSFIYPKGLWDSETVEYLQMENRFSAGYRYVSYAGALSGPITDRWTISRGDGSVGMDNIRPQMNVASMFNDLMVLAFHGVGSDGDMSISANELEQIITYGKDRGMKFVTLSDIEESMMAKMA